MKIAIVFMFCFMSSWSFAHGALEDQTHTLSHAISSHPEDASLYVKRGLVYLEGGHTEKARRDFEKALSLPHPDHAAHYHLGQAALNSGDPKRALTHAQLFLGSLHTERGARTRAHRLLGACYNALGDYAQAVNHFERAINHAETLTPDLFTDLAYALEQNTPYDLAPAIAALDRGMTEMGSLPVLADKKIALLRKAGKLDEAIVSVSKLIKTSQRLPYLYELKGDLLREANRSRDAAAAYREALGALDQIPASRSGSPAIKTQRERIESVLKHAESQPLSQVQESSRQQSFVNVK